MCRGRWSCLVACPTRSAYILHNVACVYMNKMPTECWGYILCMRCVRDEYEVCVPLSRGVFVLERGMCMSYITNTHSQDVRCMYMWVMWPINTAVYLQHAMAVCVLPCTHRQMVWPAVPSMTAWTAVDGCVLVTLAAYHAAKMLWLLFIGSR
jgi:hypothetical protein